MTQNKHVAKVSARNAAVSKKASLMIANAIRGKKFAQSLAFLQRVTELKSAVAYTKFTDGVGHRPGMGAGRYPKKAAQQFIMMLKSAQHNAQQIGLSDDLIISHVCVNKGVGRMRQGRHTRREAKSVNIDIELCEAAQKAAPKKAVEVKKDGN